MCCAHTSALQVCMSEISLITAILCRLECDHFDMPIHVTAVDHGIWPTFCSWLTPPPLERLCLFQNSAVIAHDQVFKIHHRPGNSQALLGMACDRSRTPWHMASLPKKCNGLHAFPFQMRIKILHLTKDP